MLLSFSVQLLASPVKAHHNPTFGFAGTAGPIITNPATTIPKGRFAFGIRSEYVNFNELSIDGLKFLAKKREFVHSTSSFLSPSFVGGYGLTDDFTFAIRFPYNIQSEIVDGLLNKSGNTFLVRRGTSDGLGDLTLFAQFRFLNLKDKALEAALLSGVNIPGGIAHVKDKVGQRFGADHQPGKRSFDPIVGLSITKRFGHKLSFDTNYLFTKAVRGIQRFYPGDLHNYNVAFSYRILEPHHHRNSNDNLHEHEHKHTFGPYAEQTYEHAHLHKHKWYSNFGIDTVIELNGEWRQKQEFGTLQPFGFKDENSGGNIVYISPGIRLAIDDRISTYTSFGIPTIQNPNGKGQKTDFRILFGVSSSF